MTTGAPGLGACLWLTGLSGAGKSTLAHALAAELSRYDRPVVVLDGDDVRARLTSHLGYSRADRDANAMIIAARAREAVDQHQIAGCALVTYRQTRARVRERIGPDRFLEVFVDVPLAVCEARDTKGLYARAARRELTGLTGIDDPYEPPLAPNLRLDSVHVSVNQNVQRLVAALWERHVALRAAACRDYRQCECSP